MRNPILSTLTRSTVATLIFAVGGLAIFSASAADPVYKWKDSSGESHYSQTAPQGIKYETVTTTAGPTMDASAPTDDKAPPQTAQATQAPVSGQPTPAQVARKHNCEVAQKNVEALTTRPLVQMDIHNDGKPVTLTPEQQTQQLNLAKQQAALLCVK